VVGWRSVRVVWREARFDGIGIRAGVEVAAHDDGMAAVGGPCHKGGELPDLGLAHTAGMQRVVEHDDKQLNRAPGTVDDGEQRLAVSVIVVASKHLTLALCDRPT
jgi:hypothetical protein